MAEPAYLVQAELSPALSRAERRMAERHFCRRRPEVRLLTRPGLQVLNARVENVSSNGLRLLVGGPLEPGTILGLQLRNDRPSLIQSARVVYAKQHSEGEWAVGCKLSVPLSAGELKSLVD
jgi:hypothetical protein